MALDGQQRAATRQQLERVPLLPSSERRIRELASAHRAERQRLGRELEAIDEQLTRDERELAEVLSAIHALSPRENTGATFRTHNLCRDQPEPEPEPELQQPQSVLASAAALDAELKVSYIAVESLDDEVILEDPLHVPVSEFVCRMVARSVAPSCLVRCDGMSGWLPLLGVLGFTEMSAGSASGSTGAVEQEQMQAQALQAEWDGILQLEAGLLARAVTQGLRNHCATLSSVFVHVYDVVRGVRALNCVLESSDSPGLFHVGAFRFVSHLASQSRPRWRLRRGGARNAPRLLAGRLHLGLIFRWFALTRYAQELKFMAANGLTAIRPPTRTARGLPQLQARVA
jgi:hypothetical protein